VFCDGTGHIPADLSMTLSHPVNLNPVMVKGFEIFYQQPFSFLPDPFDGLGALANFTYTAGKQSGPNTGFNVNTPCGPGSTSCANWTAPSGFVVSVPEQINGLSPYTYSATLYYEKGGLSVRASYNWRSKFVSISNNYYETNGHMIGQARGTLDGTIGYSFLDKLEVRLDVTNLLDAVEYQYLAPGVNGINYPGRYAQWGDNSSHIFYSMYHGRNFTLSLRGHL
jgi:TonB-dependent receptor